MAFEPVAPPVRVAPRRLADDTFLIRSMQPAAGQPMSVYLNSLVIRAQEPVIVDTGTVANRTQWLEDVFSIVEPKDVRWIFLSHEDHDHTGNMAQVLEACPNATLVCSWAIAERYINALAIPERRSRWVGDGESLDVGDRTLVAMRPPCYDAPTTRGLFDPKTGVYWAVDCFATPMPAEPVDTVADIPAEMWEDGSLMFHRHGLSPWLSLVDDARYQATVDRVAELPLTVVGSAHSPVIEGPQIKEAIQKVRELPHKEPPPMPDQAVLELMLASVTE